MARHNNQAAAAEQRTHTRDEVQRRGVVVHGPTGRGFSCMIVDVSPGGARLQLFDPSCPADELTLIDATLGHIHEIRVAWRNDPFLGVAYLSSEALP